MLDLDELQFLAQITDSIEISIEELEKAYQENDSENFENAKKTILEFQGKIAGILEGAKGK